MGLTRTVPASPGYSELRTYGCRECGVWVTEGSSGRDQRPDAFVVPKQAFQNKAAWPHAFVGYIFADTSPPCVCLFDPN